MSVIVFTENGFEQYDEANRLVYEISNDQIIVKACKGHYEY